MEAMIIVGITSMLFINAMLVSMSDHWRDEIINSDLGHFQIMREGYKDKRFSNAIDLTMPDADKIVSEVRAVPTVSGAMKRISIGGLITYKKKTSSFFGPGVDYASVDQTLPSLYKNLIEGGPLAQDKEVIVGEGLAKNLGVGVGESVTLASYDKGQRFNSLVVTVRGVMKIPDDSVNERFALTTYATAQSLASLGDEATEIVVRASGFDSAEATTAEVAKALGNGLAVFGWRDLAGSFNQVRAGFMTVSSVVSFIVCVVVLIGLANSILMSVFERTREIGTFLAMGTRRSWIIIAFILEGVFLTLVGVVLGALIHGVVMWQVSTSGIPIPPPPGTNASIVIHPLFRWGDVLVAATLLCVAAVIGALYPSRFASKLDPIEALRAR